MKRSLSIGMFGIVLLLLVTLAYAGVLSYYGKIVGTATVTAAPKWVQTTQSDFDAGIKTNVKITNVVDGEVQLIEVVTLDQSQTTDDKNSDKIEKDSFEAQTFVAGKSGKLVTITIKAKRGGEGNNPQPLVVELRNVVEKKPSTTILASVEIPHTAIGTTLAEHNFTFPTPPDITSGTSYAIVVRQKFLNGTVDYKIRIDKDNPYTNGARLISTDGGSSWSVQTGDDIWFKTYVEAYATSGNLVSPVFDSTYITDWKLIRWNADTPPGTNVIIQTRTSNDTISWSDFLDQTNNTDVTSPNSRYIQYKAILMTTDPSKTPVLNDITIWYKEMSD